jgi:CBS domain-containing protein
MKVAKIMRTDVVTLRTDMAIGGAWRQMREQTLDTLPVTDPAGRLIGMLTEHDLLARLVPRTARQWWRVLVDEDDRLAAAYVKAVGATVGEVMTGACPALVPDAPIEAAAAVMRRHRLSALAVVVNDICVGLVTRPDVLTHLPWPTTALLDTVADAELECLMQEALGREVWASRHRVTVAAADGVVRLTGVVGSASERLALRALARSLPGAIRVEDHLRVQTMTSPPDPAPVI